MHEAVYAATCILNTTSYNVQCSNAYEELHAIDRTLGIHKE